MITPNPDPSSLKNTMITGYDVNQGYKPVQVPKGQHVPGISATPAPQGQAGQQKQAPFMDMGVFGKAMTEMQTQLGQNNDLMAQKKTLLMQLYDRPLTDDEKKILTPSQQSAIDGNNRNLIDMELRLINDTVQGRTNSLDSSVKYITDLYTQQKTDTETKQKEAVDNVMQFVTQYGSNAKQAMTALYGADKVAQLEQLSGVDLEKAGAMPPTLAESKLDSWTYNPMTGDLYNKYTGQSKASGGGSTYTAPDGTTIDLSQYNSNEGYGTNVQTNYKGGQTPDAGSIDNYIQSVTPGSKITGAMVIAAASKNQLPYEAVTAVMQQEMGGFDSGVLQKNNNPGGVTWSDTYGKNHPGTSKGSARPEGGNYVKFKTLQDGVNAVADAIALSDKNSAGTQNNIQLIAQGIMNGDQPPTTTGLYRNSAAVRAELEKNKFDLSKANLEWTALQKWTASANSSQQLRMRQAEQSVKQSLGNLQTISDSFKRTGFKFVNRAELVAAANGAQGQEIASQAQQLLGQVSLITDELGQTFMGGNSPTDAAFGLAAKVLEGDFSSDVLTGQIALIKQNLTYRENSWKLTGAVTPGGGDNTYAAAAPTSAGGNTYNGITLPN